MKQLKRSYVRSARLLFALLLVCMIAGSIYDFQISSFLYPGKESSFGQFFAAFGELPAFLALICAGVLLFRHRGCLRRDWNVLFLIGAFGLIFGGIFLSVHEATDNVPAMPAWVPLLVTVFFAAVCSAALLLVTSGAQGKTVIRFVLTLIFVCVGTMLLINIIKVPWGRARMRLIASTGNASYFTPWWKAGSSLKNQLVAEGVRAYRLRRLCDARCASSYGIQAVPRKGKTTGAFRRALDRDCRVLPASYGCALSDGRDYGVARYAGADGAGRVSVLFQQEILPVRLGPYLRA